MKIILIFIFYFIMSSSLIIGSFLVLKRVKGERVKNPILSPIAKTIVNPIIQNVESFFKPTVEDSVKKTLLGVEGNYAVVVENLKTGERFSRNGSQIFESASLYKLWVMEAAFAGIKDGKLKNNNVLSANVGFLNDKFNLEANSGELKDDENVTFTVISAIERMITISHNYAALLLSYTVGPQSITNFLKLEGMDNSKIGNPPKTTAEDIALFFEKLYDGRILDKEYSEKMLEVLSRQQINDRLPKLLPEGTRVAHKTGELNGYKHDAGIVFSPKGDYILVVLTNTNDPKNAAETTALLSKSVYDYFNQ